jgi:hypothetical protein
MLPFHNTQAQTGKYAWVLQRYVYHTQHLLPSMSPSKEIVGQELLKYFYQEICIDQKFRGSFELQSKTKHGWQDLHLSGFK